MKTHEYQAREILKGYGIPFPPAGVAETPEEAEAIARELGGNVVVKAQALVGGRGKAGGIKRAATPDEAREAAAAMLGAPLKGKPVRKVLVAQVVPVVREYYLGAVLDRSAKAVTIMVERHGRRGHRRGGPHVARRHHPGLRRSAARSGRLPDSRPGPRRRPHRRPGQARSAPIARALYKAFFEMRLLAARGQSAGSDREPASSSLSTPRWSSTTTPSPGSRPWPLCAIPSAEEPAEAEAREVGVSYVELDGNVGCLVNGAGLAMATMDVDQAVRGRAGELPRHRRRRPHRAGRRGPAHHPPRSRTCGPCW